MSALPLNLDPDKMTVSEFKQYMPELAAAGEGKVSEDARFAGFFVANPDCLALVKDLETIADAAKSLFEPVGDPRSGPTSPASSSKGIARGARISFARGPACISQQPPLVSSA
jgi:hypothetical protein